MQQKRNTPRRLYKYRKFNEHTLDMIVNDMVFYADPSTFNDPLDTSPLLENDIEESELTALLVKIAEKRTRAELTSTFNKIGDKRPRTQKDIQLRARQLARRLVNEIDFAASDPVNDVGGTVHKTDAERLTAYTRYRIKEELRQQYDKGVVSLSTTATCPLMWSHYSDHHRGICIGYSDRKEDVINLQKVKYGSSRLVKASDVTAMLDGDNAAKVKVDGAVFLRKAEGWHYEKEWRLIGSRGYQRSPIEMEEIIFGLRCDNTVMYTVMVALEGRERPVNFYKISDVSDTFNLEKRQLDLGDERFWEMPRRSPSPSEYFKDISIASESSTGSE